MHVESPMNLRNVAVVGHSSTGKTSLVSDLLFTSGATNRRLSVEDGNTLTDFDAQEIERQISIALAAAHLSWRDHKVNLLDCPGYGIFFTDTRAGMRVADAALVCVSGIAGVEVNTEKCWNVADELDLPVGFHLTKMDREHTDFDSLVDELRERFSRTVVPLHLPIGSAEELSGIVDVVSGEATLFEKDGNGRGSSGEIPEELRAIYETRRSELVELVAETDEELMDTYFSDLDLSDDELQQGLRRAVERRLLYPLTLGSALHGIGGSALLDHLVDAFPSPIDRGAYPATDIGGQPLDVEPDPDGPTAALVFKTLSDPFTGKISLFRVVRGTIESDSTLWNVDHEEDERMGHIHHVQGKDLTHVPSLVAGDIGGAAKLKHTETGDTLTVEERPLKLGWIEVPEPAISFAIEPKSKSDEEKIGEALHRLLEEDPMLSAGRDPQTGEYLLSGTGQLHVEIAVAKLKNRSNVEVILHPPKVPYRETIRRAATGHGRHKKQSGGRGQFADCSITVEPLPRGEDFEFVDEIFGGAIPRGFRPAVAKGIEEARQRGYLAGYPVVDFRVRLQDGKHHDVDSSEIAFKIAGSLAFKDAMRSAGPTILEPIMELEITAGEEHTGDVLSDLSQRRGRPQGMDSQGRTTRITALAPMAELLNYAPALRSMTQGRASFHMEFSHYDQVPRQLQERLIAESQGQQAAEA